MFSFAPAETGFGVPCLKAGDITIDLNGKSISNQLSGSERGYDEVADRGSAHIQSLH